MCWIEASDLFRRGYLASEREAFVSTLHADVSMPSLPISGTLNSQLVALSFKTCSRTDGYLAIDSHAFVSTLHVDPSTSLRGLEFTMCRSTVSAYSLHAPHGYLARASQAFISTLHVDPLMSSHHICGAQNSQCVVLYFYTCSRTDTLLVTDKRSFRRSMLILRCRCFLSVVRRIRNVSD